MSKKVIIVGDPNSGKSILFNKLSKVYSIKGQKKYSIVANYPYTTIEPIRTTLQINDEKFELIDSPGLNTLVTTSEDEISVRNMIIKESPDLIIQSLNSNKIEKSLFLTAQLLELNTPMILVLNFIDETHKKGIWLDSKKLEQLTGIPTVESIAPEGKGFADLAKEILIALKKNPQQRNFRESLVKYNDTIKHGINVIDEVLTSHSHSHSHSTLSTSMKILLLLEDLSVELLVKDTYGEQVIKKVKERIIRYKNNLNYNFFNQITIARLNWVDEIAENIIKESQISASNIQEKIGRYSRHPIWGWPILALVMYLTYLLVGQLAANTMVSFLENYIFHPLYQLIGQNIEHKILRDFLVGEYGILSTGLGNALATALPILCMFFLILNMMEDSGYFTNVCILVSRFTKKLGLSGQSILPLMLAFGCKTMATLTTQILSSKKERYIAIFLIAFAIPCSPQMGLILGILASSSFSAFVIVFTSLVIAEFCAGIILNKILKDDIRTDFILEIPPIRIPKFQDIFLKLYYRMKWFLKEIPPLFMIGAFLLFVLDQTHALIIIKKALTPIVVSFLSLPIQTVDAFLLCLVKHEAGAVQLLNLSASNSLSHLQIIVSLIIITTLGPCFANLMAIIKQIKLKQAIVMRVIILVAAILTGGAVNWLYKLSSKI
ncbi:MAG: ferrous iron transport protein B [Oligoflexia bacterium]|nr:ferrous iron transport protein B [Oligoflexia bacterium]